MTRGKIKYTLDKARKAIEALAHSKDRDAFLVQHAKMLLALPEEEATPIFAAVTDLANTIPEMGPRLAFELVIKLGRKLEASASRRAVTI